MKVTPTALITGGSRGIGAATSRALAEQGYAICMAYRSDRDSANELRVELQAAGHRVIAVQADVSSEDEAVDLFRTCDRELGPLTALVNNAGIVAERSRVDSLSASRVRRLLDTNVLGPILCCREAVRRMSTRHGGAGGAIVNVSSVAARAGSPGEYVDYAASKGAVDTLTTGLALEVADEGIRVNAVRPGIIDTEIHASGGQPNRLEQLASTIPMRRGGTAEEIADAIVWLLSAKASYTTGAILDVSGGR